MINRFYVYFLWVWKSFLQNWRFKLKTSSRRQRSFYIIFHHNDLPCAKFGLVLFIAQTEADSVNYNQTFKLNQLLAQLKSTEFFRTNKEHYQKVFNWVNSIWVTVYLYNLKLLQQNKCRKFYCKFSNNLNFKLHKIELNGKYGKMLHVLRGKSSWKYFQLNAACTKSRHSVSSVVCLCALLIE